MRALVGLVIALSCTNTLAFQIAVPVLGNSGGDSYWQQVSSALQKEIPGLIVGPGFQVLSVPLPADWDDPRFGDYRAWSVLGDTIPKSGKTYEPTLYKVSQAYFIFITNIDIPPLSNSDLHQVKRLRKKWTDAHQRLEQLETAYGKNPSQANRLALEKGKLDLESIAREYSQRLAKAYAGFAGAGDLVTDYENPAYQQTALSPDGLKLSYRTFTIDPSLSQWLAQARGEPLNLASSPNVASIASVRRIEDSYLFRKVPGQIKPNLEAGEPGYDASRPGGIDYHFVVNFRSQTGTNSSPDVIDQAIIRARRFAVFSIHPGKWFNSEAFKVFHNGPWIDGPVKSGKIKLWGDDGILSRIPARLIVAYSPSVELSIRTATMNQVKSLLDSTAELSVGPFTFRLKGADTSSLSILEESTGKLTLSDPGHAYVLAVDSEVFLQ